MYEAIKQFLKPPSEGGAYTDERLAMLLAHAEDGKLVYQSCCCFIGIPTADHALQGDMPELGEPGKVPHYQSAKLLSGALDAEYEFFMMAERSGYTLDWQSARAKLIPLIKEEMERRALNELSSETTTVESQEFCPALTK